MRSLGGPLGGKGIMTKAEIIARVASRKDLPRGLTKKSVAQIIEATFTELGDYFIRARVGGTHPARFSYPGFGTFVKRKRNQRQVRNPRTGSAMTIPAQATITFAPGQDLKDLINQRPRVNGRSNG
jgi:nucleoid DNA-binding protein